MPSNRKQIAKVKSKDEESINLVAGRYNVIKKLGSGSYGTVFLISDTKKEGDVTVLKKIHIGDLQPDDTIDAAKEAHLLSKLDHPGIVRFHRNFIDKEYFCIITEYCEGGDLEDKLQSWKRNGKSVDRNLILTWFVQLVLAVQFIHQRRVLHRDLKTRNIFLKNNMVKIGDFGISRILQGSTDVATTFTGTPYFMAPEILKHEGYNSKSDIWSLGVILYEMCTLRKAFQGSSLMAVMMNIVQGDIPKLPSRFKEELHQIYESMLSRDPTSRTSATEIIKKPYIVKHLEKLKIKVQSDRTIDRKQANQEALEIARALSNDKISRNKQHQFVASSTDVRPLTPKEQMKIRKQQKADEELERLKKLTVKTYNESRRKCTDIKQRLEHSSVEDDKTHHIDVNVIEATSESFDVFRLPSQEGEHSKIERARVYTHCFGEEDETELIRSYSEYLDQNKEKEFRKYTHCFGDSSSEDEEERGGGNVGEEDEDEVFEETLVKSRNNNDSLELTNVSSIPEDANFADTFYSTYDDFEDDESDDNLGLVTDDYGVLVGYMENALEMTDDGESTFGDVSSSTNGSSIRQEKIQKLKQECIRLLGKDGFERVYNFLNEVRFDPSKKMSEENIMRKLRRIVGSSRDCFLVDQLIFLEKQDQIFTETF